MKKSTPGYISGFIGTLWIFIISISTTISFTFLTDLINTFNSITDSDLIIEATAQNLKIAPLILSWIMLAGAIIGIIGSILCKKKANKGAILMTVSLFTTWAFFIYILAIMIEASPLITATIILFFIIPTIFIATGLSFAYSAKEIHYQKIIEEKTTPEKSFIKDIENYFKYQTKQDSQLTFNLSIEKEYNLDLIKKELAEKEYFIAKKENKFIIKKANNNKGE